MRIRLARFLCILAEQEEARRGLLIVFKNFSVLRAGRYEMEVVGVLPCYFQRFEVLRREAARFSDCRRRY